MARRVRSVEERLAGLESMLARPTTSWSEVMTALSTWPADQALEGAIAAVEAAADRWPPAARGLARVTVQQLLAGEVRPHLRLVRALDLRPLWSHRHRAALLGRMIAEGGVRELHTFILRYDEGEAILALLTRHVRGLRVLYLGGSGVETTGACALAECAELAELGHLALHNNRIDDEGALALARSPHLGSLRSLNLYNNRLTPPGVEALRGLLEPRQVRLIVHKQHHAG